VLYSAPKATQAGGGCEAAGTGSGGRPAAERAWVTEITADPDAGWVVTAEQDDVVLSADPVRQVRELFTALEERLPGVVYDGWRASL
jgi:hypothetical protein